MIGERFGRLVVISKSDRIASNGYTPYLTCKCDCGRLKDVIKYDLIHGKSKSCGCLRRELVTQGNITHNQSNSRLYKTWCSMKYRCYAVNCKDYKWYGGKGVVMCEEWASSFSIFMEWAASSGYENSLTIDRIDSSLGYAPNNCQWITQGENAAKANNERWGNI